MIPMDRPVVSQLLAVARIRLGERPINALGDRWRVNKDFSEGGKRITTVTCDPADKNLKNRKSQYALRNSLFFNMFISCNMFLRVFTDLVILCHAGLGV